jgi:SAM-dependent methyltransferase
MSMPGAPSPSADDHHDLLRWCQDEIARCDPHPYYVEAYRGAETSYWQHIPGWMAADAALLRPGRCLDIGCAYGTLLLLAAKMTGGQGYGIDFVGRYMSPTLLAKHALEFAVSNIELDPIPWPGRYDVVVFTEVLEHLNFQPLPTLRKIRQSLTDEGALYLSTPDAAQWGRVTKYYAQLSDLPAPAVERRATLVDDHVWQYTEAELRELLAAAGLRIKRFDYAPGAAARHFNLTLERA